MYGIVDTGAYKFTVFFLPTNHHVSLQHPGDAAKAAFFDLGALLVMLSLAYLSGTGVFAFFFFSRFDQTHDQG
jgi:hypothetical protein